MTHTRSLWRCPDCGRQFASANHNHSCGHYSLEAAAMPRTRWLDGYLWLRRQAVHPCFRKIEMGIFRNCGHLFRLSRPEDRDESLVELLYEAYILGYES